MNGKFFWINVHYVFAKLKKRYFTDWKFKVNSVFFVLQVATKFNNSRTEISNVSRCFNPWKNRSKCCITPRRKLWESKNERRCNAPTATESFYHSRLNLSPHSALFKCAFLFFFSQIIITSIICVSARYQCTKVWFALKCLERYNQDTTLTHLI